MPLYEYRCTQCRALEEVLQGFSDPSTPACPKCGSEMKRQISAPAIQFKGSGFYKTDYPSASSSAASASGTSKESSDSKASESKSDGKVESKSESKAESKSEPKAESKSSSKSESAAKISAD